MSIQWISLSRWQVLTPAQKDSGFFAIDLLIEDEQTYRGNADQQADVERDAEAQGITVQDHLTGNSYGSR